MTITSHAQIHDKSFAFSLIEHIFDYFNLYKLFLNPMYHIWFLFVVICFISKFAMNERQGDNTLNQMQLSLWWHFVYLDGCFCIVFSDSEYINCSSESEFDCGHSVCIGRWQICNNYPDCLDGRDELNCGNYSRTTLDYYSTALKKLNIYETLLS